MALNRVSRHILSRLAQAPNGCFIKVVRNADDWKTIENCHLEYSDNTTEADEVVSRNIFDALRKERFIEPNRTTFSNVQCWVVTEAGKLASQIMENSNVLR